MKERHSFCDKGNPLTQQGFLESRVHPFLIYVNSFKILEEISSKNAIIL